MKREKRELVHGTNYGYRVHKCRCAACRRANCDYQIKYQQGKVPPRGGKKPDPAPSEGSNIATGSISTAHLRNW